MVCAVLVMAAMMTRLSSCSHQSTLGRLGCEEAVLRTQSVLFWRQEAGD